MKHQAGIPRTMPKRGSHANGLLMRGVVTATYEIDSPSHPFVGIQPVAIYCDVLAYSTRPSIRYQFLQQVLVTQNHGGIHSGEVWKPRAATIDITAKPLALDGTTNPATLDGDHVLIGFLDDMLHQPVILRSIPHPSADLGNDAKTVGHRLKLKVADGDPHFWKHHGAFYGLDKLGNFTVDTTEANDGVLLPTGAEAPPPVDGTKGNYTVNMPLGAKLTVNIAGAPNLVLELNGATAKLTLGDGAKHVVLGEGLQAFFDTVFAAWDKVHTHPTAMGPSGPPIESPTFPAYDVATINSTKMAVPNG